MFWAQHRPRSAEKLRGFWFHGQTGQSISHLPAGIWAVLFGRSLTLKRSPQCWAYTQALHWEKSKSPLFPRSVRVAERLALPTSDHGVAGSNPAGGEILPEPKRCFIAQSLSCSLFHSLEMTEILLKGHKTIHPSHYSLALCGRS